jgi:site-specific DNA-methyltransferase (adenine-specific)
MVTDNAVLLLGDCLEQMKAIPNESIDLILADLPYGTTVCKWDSVLDLAVLWGHYERIIKPNGAIVLFAQTPFDKVLGASNLEMLRYEWIWEKEMGTGFLNAKKHPLKSHENILVFYKTRPTYNPQMTEGKPYTAIKQLNPYAKEKVGTTGNYKGDSIAEVVTKNDGKRYPKTVLRFNRDKVKYHPTQKPVALLEYLIQTYTNEGETVLDNTMGSGSTGVACKNLGRKFIGIEKDPKYFEIAKTRIFNSFPPVVKQSK